MEFPPIIDKNDSLKGWTKEEKFQLLQALKEHGLHNIKEIIECFVNKSEDEIKRAIEYYKNKALIHPKMQEKKSKKCNNLPTIPLASWAKFLIESYGFEDLQTETATALRIIADFEDKPPAVCTNKFDFKKIYHMLADALEGKPIPHDKLTMAMFDKCIVETALTSKAFIRSTAYKQILQSINISEKNMNVLTKPTEDNELSILRHLASQKNYNPLNIPENYLKSSSHTS
ncbi:uncharacterized protein LOC113393236 [Vanessa tameamea]|uniref:Uncharacterized protein LOC113393236 n=1 Tax=Vanessa tameamea TaxID=334116 RepID=A0A8B8HM85_VANTA|nr:uncharacterized protein LOC113393236 [Vanessa tameamea]